MVDERTDPILSADQLRAVLRGLSALDRASENEFFAVLARCVSELVGADPVIVYREGSRAAEAETLAVLARGRLRGGFRFPLTGPAENPEAEPAADDSAPAHPLAERIGAVDLQTLPLRQGAGEAQGWISLGPSQHHELPSDEAASLLDPLLARAASELRRQQRRETLLAERDRYRRFFEGDLVGTFMSRLEGEIVDCNRAFAKILGYASAEEVKAQDARRFYWRVADRDAAIDRMRRDGTIARYRNRLKRKDGSPVDIICYAQGRFDENGAMLGMIGIIFEDSDQQKFRDRVLEQSALLARTAEAVIVCRPDGVVKSWNTNAQTLFRFSPDTARGADWRHLLGAALDADLEAAWAELLETDHWAGEWRLESPAGSRKVVRSRWSLLREPRGEPRSVLMVSTDVTESRALEATFYRTQRLESLGTLAGGIAHDLNNVLTPILLSANLLKGSIQEPKDRQLLDSLAATAQRGKDMVQQILWFARGTGGNRTPFRLDTVLQELRRVLQHTLPRSIELETKFASDLLPILGDATQIFQALMNVCLNARDAMPSGGLLRIRGRVAKVNADDLGQDLETPVGLNVVLEVSDTGCGIPQQELAKIFDPFFSTKGAGNGTGLGLTTANSIIKSHGGSIDVLSRPSHGTVFRIFLPALDPESLEEAVEEPTLQPPPGAERTILIADDDPDVLELTSTTLESHGYRVLRARDGSEALEIFAEESDRVSGVLCDQDMPILDGLATLRVMARMAPEVKLLLITGLPGFTPALDSVRVLRKPWTPIELLQAVGAIFLEAQLTPVSGITVPLPEPPPP